MRKVNPSGDTEGECLENGEKRECWNQESSMCVTMNLEHDSELKLEVMKRPVEYESHE